MDRPARLLVGVEVSKAAESGPPGLFGVHAREPVFVCPLVEVEAHLLLDLVFDLFPAVDRIQPPQPAVGPGSGAPHDAGCMMLEIAAANRSQLEVSTSSCRLPASVRV